MKKHLMFVGMAVLILCTQGVVAQTEEISNSNAQAIDLRNHSSSTESRQNISASKTQDIHTKLQKTKTSFWYVGVGFVTSGFTSQQSLLGISDPKQSTRGNGFEIFTTYESYFDSLSKAGFRFSIGIEYLTGLSWTQFLVSNILVSNMWYTNTSNQILTIYYTAGLVYDVWKKNRGKISIFADVGFDMNFLFGDTYNYANLNTNSYMTFGLPLMIGVRGTFAQHHNIELVGKIHPLDVVKQSAYINGYYNGVSIDTTISRSPSVAVRYSYAF